MKKNYGMLALIMAFWFTISFITNILDRSFRTLSITLT